jgi:hypothetical protein
MTYFLCQSSSAWGGDTGVVVAAGVVLKRLHLWQFGSTCSLSTFMTFVFNL